MGNKERFVFLLSLLSAAVFADELVHEGIVREDAEAGDIIMLAPPLYVANTTGLTGTEICGYTLYMTSTVMPFHVVITERNMGHAKLVVEHGYTFNYSSQSEYEFEVAGHDCDQGTHAAKERIHVRVKPIPVSAPVHVASLPLHPISKSDSIHTVFIAEGKLVDNVFQLPGTGSNCRYRLLTHAVPFAISEQGVLSNTQPLAYSVQHNYILHLAGDNCAQQAVVINVKVTQDCQAKWTGIDSRIDYAPDGKTQLLAEHAHLDMCGKTCSTPVDIATQIQLTTKHIGKGCDRDTYSMAAQRKRCGAVSSSHDLLPSGSTVDQKGAAHDDGREGDEMYMFDGHTKAVIVPEDRLNHSLSSHFTISVWMRHDDSLARTSHVDKKHSPKEHILCNADGDGKNRHHYSLFTHNCKLILLLRQEPVVGSQMNVLKPAEWRWKPHEVCDNRWHHYAVSVDFPEVRLYVDGKLALARNKEPQTFDDWPLHRSKQVHFTKLVVGACWAGRDKHLVQYFRGYLAGLNVVQGATESDRVIRCLNDCQEKLDFHVLDKSSGNLTVAFNSEMTQLTIRGDSIAVVESMVQRVGYVNSRLFPTPGRRGLTVSTQLKCASVRVPVDTVHSAIWVQKAAAPSIRIHADAQVSFSVSQLHHGVKPFRSVSLVSGTTPVKLSVDNKAKKMASTLFTNSDSKPVADNTERDRYNLDSCVIRLPPGEPLNPKMEHFIVPMNLEAQLHLSHAQLPDGSFVISGVAKVSHYEMMLRQLHYAHTQPQRLASRTFVLSCSELNGRFASNEITVKLDVVHAAPVFPDTHHAMSAAAKDAPKMNALKMNSDSAIIKSASHNPAGLGMVIIIVVSVSLLVLFMVLAVIRIRATQGRRRQLGAGSGAGMEEKQEMEWDNSELTITVNPMEQEMEYMDRNATTMKCEDSDSDDDDSVCYHDEIESSEDEAEKMKYKELEWDDSTLSL